ncbi:MAG: DUF3014 domain-containing protein [Betaproteobacteria bacterium]|nr:DUF3014 domain-containing protein [Betaproteobacteria bacterium]MDE2122823.1 DUF3014 domain-containing protein [Betaproteobacteria bacterium]MDE2323397.1 DUF3014 domain-containing protein [Betaproteobacteria bacterium]
MKNPMLIVAVVLVALVAAIGYVNWQRSHQPAELHPSASAAATAAQNQPVAGPASVPASSPASAPQLVLPQRSAANLPRLDQSDGAFGQALAGLIGHKAFAQWLIPHRLILHIVATIDNLPRRQAPVKAWPVSPVPGTLRTSGTGADLAISSDNAQRYAPYLQVLQQVRPQALVEVYLEFYPLFQQAYTELGYPHGDFNSRLLVVIDNLLAAPEPKPPVLLAQPKVLYQYADPRLESASAGQKIMMRLGPAGEADVKAKLRAIRQALLAKMHPGASSPAG